MIPSNDNKNSWIGKYSLILVGMFNNLLNTIKLYYKLQKKIQIKMILKKYNIKKTQKIKQRVNLLNLMIQIKQLLVINSNLKKTIN